MTSSSFGATLLAAFLSLIGWSSPDAVVARRAAVDLACERSELDVSCRGGIVFHLAEQFQCEARGCGRTAAYRCEAPLRNVGPFERRLEATCE